MSAQSIVLVGLPDTGKTNYLARLWEALRSGEGQLLAPTVPEDIKYVEDALAHILSGEFAPRSDKNLEACNFSLPVVFAKVPNAEPLNLVVPDVTGELWKSAVETSEIAEEWMGKLRQAAGGLLFARIQSDLNVAPLDWVTTARLLRLPLMQTNKGTEGPGLPTQVALCELLRFLAQTLTRRGDGKPPRLAVLLTAWDLLDQELSEAGPNAFLKSEYPLFAGRLKDIECLDIRVFGVSIVGGDFADQAFQRAFLEHDLTTAGYVITDVGGRIGKSSDLTLPIAWVAEGLSPGK